jgi:hypothetical protein
MDETQQVRWGVAGRNDRERREQVRRREEARDRLRQIARAEGVQWLLREAQVIALWANDFAH